MKSRAARKKSSRRAADSFARGRARSGGRDRATAQSLAAQQREISVSEFFTKNRHLLGFDSPTKALLITIRADTDEIGD